MRTAYVLAWALLVATPCVALSAPPPVNSRGESLEQFLSRVSPNQTPTDDPGILGIGRNTFSGTFASKCISFDPTAILPDSSDLGSFYDLQYYRSADEVVESKTFGAAMVLGYGLFGAGAELSAAHRTASAASISRRQRVLIATVHVGGNTQRLGSATGLIPSAPSSDSPEFVRRCGDVVALALAQRALLRIAFTTSDEDRSAASRADWAISGSVKGLGARAEADASFAQTIRSFSSSSRVNIIGYSEGYNGAIPTSIEDVLTFVEQFPTIVKSCVPDISRSAYICDKNRSAELAPPSFQMVPEYRDYDTVVGLPSTIDLTKQREYFSRLSDEYLRTSSVLNEIKHGYSPGDLSYWPEPTRAQWSAWSEKMKSHLGAVDQRARGCGKDPTSCVPDAALNEVESKTFLAADMPQFIPPITIRHDITLSSYIPILRRADRDDGRVPPGMNALIQLVGRIESPSLRKQWDPARTPGLIIHREVSETGRTLAPDRQYTGLFCTPGGQTPYWYRQTVQGIYTDDYRDYGDFDAIVWMVEDDVLKTRPEMARLCDGVR